jgi:protein-S-isoprenylcysteine O-methyltransferase Ste14
VLHIILEAIALWQTGLEALQIMGVCPIGERTRVYPRAVLPAQAFIGIAFLLFGSCLRISCFNKLGSFFVWEFAVQKSHTLITTGPYSFVRHPSYTGMFANLVGWLMLVTSSHTVFRECIWEKYPLFAALDVAFVGMSAFTLAVWLSVFKTRLEDEMLKEKFGTIWEEWAAKTPYKILPLVY